MIVCTAGTLFWVAFPFLGGVQVNAAQEELAPRGRYSGLVHGVGINFPGRSDRGQTHENTPFGEFGVQRTACDVYVANGRRTDLCPYLYSFVYLRFL